MPSVFVLIIVELSVSMLNFNMLSIGIVCHFVLPSVNMLRAFMTSLIRLSFIQSIASTSISNDYIFTSPCLQSLMIT